MTKIKAPATGAATPLTPNPDPKAAGPATRAATKTVTAATTPVTRPAAKSTRAPAKPKAPKAAAATPAALPTDEQLLDEALTETFPASDPISPAGDVSGASSKQSEPLPEREGSTEPFHFPTADNPHPGEQHVPATHLSRDERIRRAAYFRAEGRGFQGGDEVQDWLDAEAEEDAGSSQGPA